MKRYRRITASVLTVLLVFCMGVSGTAMAEETTSLAEPTQNEDAALSPVNAEEMTEDAASDGTDENGEATQTGTGTNQSQAEADQPEADQPETPETEDESVSAPAPQAEDDSATVLYSDGTMIINELASDREANLEKHGAVVAETDPIDADNQANPPWAGISEFAEGAKHVLIGSDMTVTSVHGWFKGFGKMEVFDSTNLDAAEAPDFAEAFRGVGVDTENGTTLIGLENWQFYSHSIKDASYMFAGAKIKSIGNISSWLLGDVTSMFEGLQGELNVGSLCFSYVKTLDRFAKNATHLTATLTGIGIVPTSYEDAFLNAAPGVNTGDITLDPYTWNGDDAKNWCLDMIALYGLEGTRSQGRVHMAYTLKTVLYEDGTMIINEPIERDREANLEKHGAILQEAAQIFNYDTTGTLPWCNNADWKKQTKSIAFGTALSPDTLESWFDDFTILESFDATNLDTSNVTSMARTFTSCGLTSPNGAILKGLSDWDVSKVKTMSQMFAWSNVTIEGGLHWQIAPGTTLNSMFFDFLYDSDIGTLKIPAGCNLDSFANSPRDCKMTLIMQGLPDQDGYAFYYAASGDDGDITLIPTSEETEDWCNEMVSQYGQAGTETQGNVHLPDVDVTVPEQLVISPGSDGTLSGEAVVENNSKDYGVKLEMSVKAENDWTLVNNRADFTSFAANYKILSLTAGDIDLATDTYTGSIGNSGTLKIPFISKVGLWTQPADNMRFATLIFAFENKYY